MDAGEYLRLMGGMVGDRADRGRYNEAVQFVYSAAFGKPTPEGAEAAVAEMTEGMPVSDLDIRGVPAGVGRGASGLGIALEVAGAVSAVGGAVTVLAGFAKGVARAWKWLFRQHGPPMLSLGALKLLCIADLARRETDLDGIELLHTIEVTGEIADISHTGHDLFLISFVRPLPGYRGEGDLWLYVVDTVGQVVHFSRARWEALYHRDLTEGRGWRGGSPPAGLPPFLLDAEDAEDPEAED